jgi:hypothetical protein
LEHGLEQKMDQWMDAMLSSMEIVTVDLTMDGTTKETRMVVMLGHQKELLTATMMDT